MHSVAASILAALRQFPTPKRYVVAYSGGCDSHALLCALNELCCRDHRQLPSQLPCTHISAIHINHGLLSQSDEWEAHCMRVCNELAIDYISIQLNLTVPKGESLEAYARAARYQAIRQQLNDGDMLLLAQHQDDQAETVLLQALRGSGVKGLAAMPGLVCYGSTWQARPMLSLTQVGIEDYAVQQQINWVEDPSNREIKFDRNYLRHEVIPILKQRWPSMSETLSRVASHQADADQLITELAFSDWQNYKRDDPLQLNTAGMSNLSSARQKNLLRFWISEQCDFPVPDTTMCQLLIDEVIMASSDAEPELCWADVVVRRYRGVLYLEKQSTANTPDWQQSWDLSCPLALPDGKSLNARSAEGQGLLLPAKQAAVEVRFRRGGEKCQLPGRNHRHELKKLMQEWGVPPWQRNRIPLICVGEQVVQIVGFSVCEPYIARVGQTGYEIYINE